MRAPEDSKSSQLSTALADGGVSGSLLRSLDWSKTPVGPVESWPKSLVATIGMVLHSRHPMFLWWGPELIQFYNDAYMPSFGAGKHPAAMGQRGADCWQEIWPIISPQIDDVMQRGIASWNEDALVPIFRNGHIEEVYWTYGYSPVYDDHGRIGGTLVVCTETTSRVIANRRSELVRRLGEKLAACTELAEMLLAARELSLIGPYDVPFLLTCQSDESGPCGLSSSDQLSDSELKKVRSAVASTSSDDSHAEPRRRSLSIEAQVVNGVWQEPVTELALLRPRPSTSGLELLVFGVSPRLRLDEAYWDFFEQIADQLDRAAARLQAFRLRAAVESERRNLLLQAPVATALLTGPTHVFELANPLYRKIVGGREVLGKAYLEAFPELADSALPAVLDRVYQTGEPFVAEEYQVPFDRAGTGDLEDCYFRFSLQPLRDDDGNVRGMMAMALDVTEQVNARRVLERATLERERLLNQLKAANHAKDEFLATVSHELRTPLTSILGWSRLLSEASDPLRIQKGLAVIERNAKSQAQLIEDILDVSRIISGKLRMNMRRVDPVAVVHAAVETVRPHATAKQVRMLVDVEAGVPPLVADEDRLQQVVWNLLSNAVKFSSADGEISVRLRQVESRIVISVADKGKGISPEFLPHVFDRFRQDDTSTTKQHAGLGLGLSIVHHLVELHGGTVVARSDGEGKGACFEVSMPIRAVQLREPSEPPQPSTNEERTSGYEMPQLRGVHALVLDDQDDARELVATVLHDAGAKVTQANSVAAAMKVLAEQPVSVLVSDIGMPHEDGYSFIQRVRSDLASFESGRVPALALTAYARAEDRKKALDAGFQEHVAKPIDPLELVHVVARLIHA